MCGTCSLTEDLLQLLWEPGRCSHQPFPASEGPVMSSFEPAGFLVRSLMWWALWLYFWGGVGFCAVGIFYFWQSPNGQQGSHVASFVVSAR